MGVGAGAGVFVAVGVGDAVWLDVGRGVTVSVGPWVALGFVVRGVALCTKTAGFGSAVGAADGIQAVDRHPSAMGNSCRDRLRSPIRFMKRSSRESVIHQPYAIIMGS